MTRAAVQLKDLAARAQGASAGEWQTISKQFDELSMNISQIKHGLEELAKQRRKGGVRSRGIDPMIDSITNIEESIKKISNRFQQV
jgi:archaellum component FlaC